LYRTGDHALDFEPEPVDELQRSGQAGTASLAIATLQIEVAVDSQDLLYVWGYFPREATLQGNVLPPPAIPGCLRVRGVSGFAPGVAIDINGGKRWNAIWDQGTGWIEVSSESRASIDKFVTFATGCVAGITGGQLVSLRLHPRVCA
jgi:hypothetical protein